MAAPPRPPPALMPELVEQILLRVPPDEPATLVHAALVCKPWCRVVASAHFRRRLREIRRGRAAPLLGFLCDLRARGGGGDSLARFVPTAPSSFRPPRAADFLDLRAHDARHGRVLLHTYPYGYGHPDFAFLVWDPATDERREFPRPPRYPDSWKATVLCAAAATAGGACDHVDCHRGPFAVVFVGTDGGGMFSCVYSSEAAAWSKLVAAEHSGDRVGWERSALAGNALYFVLEESDRILKYDLGTGKISMVELPLVLTNRVFSPFEPIELTTMDDGRLGFARVEESRLCIWSRDDEDVGWALSEVIDLKKLLHLDSPWSIMPQLVGFAEGVGVVFLNVGDKTFTVDLKSGRVRKVYGGSSISCAVPYMNFCNRVLRAPTTDDGPRACVSSQGCSCEGSKLLSQGK